MFLKVHKSFVVNLGKIKSISGNEINIGGIRDIPISQNLYESVLKEIVKDKMIKR
jgi:DNA-binding LytR/AlgR family response regulator